MFTRSPHIDPTAALDYLADRNIALDESQARAFDAIRAGLGARGRPQSFYLHGPAGRGKSLLLAAITAAGPARQTRRVHFLSFFDEASRTLIDRHYDWPATFDAVLGDSAVLCFDEFHVHDIADGIFLTRLLQEAERRRITLFTTSNYPPDLDFSRGFG